MLSIIKRVFGNTFTYLKSLVVPTGRFYAPTITWLLVLSNIVIFICGYSWDFSLSRSPQPYWTLIGSMFSHANIGHLLGNMLFLSLIGPACEKNLGHLRFLLFYVVCGIAACLGYCFYHQNNYLLGASGAIAGCMAIFPFVQRFVKSVFIMGLLFGTYFWRNFEGVVGDFEGTNFSSIAYLAHVAGGVMGLILFCFFKSKQSRE